MARLFRPDPYREFFRVLADSLDEAVLVVSGDGRRVLGSNHAFLLLSGYARSELDDLSPFDLFPAEEGALAIGRIVEPSDFAELRLEGIPLRTRAGSPATVDALARPVAPGRAAFLLTLVQSGAERAEEARRRATQERLDHLSSFARDLLQGTADSLPSALAAGRAILHAELLGLYRISPTDPDYVLVGALPEEFPTRLPGTALKPFHRPTAWSLGQRSESPLAKAARSAGLHVLRTSPLGAPEAWVGVLVAGWKEESDAPEDVEHLLELLAHLCHAALQLVSQHGAIAGLEASMRQVEAQVETLFDGVSAPLLQLTSELKVVRANPAAGRVLGYRTGELNGLLIQDVLVGPEDILATLLDARGHDRMAERARITLHRRDGTPFPAQLRALPTPSEDGAGLLIELVDQSERQAIEDHTETLAQRALLGEVTAIFAHEVRNPINNISTGVQLVASRLGESHPLFESLDRVRKECIRLDQLMGDVLFFARPLELKMEDLDLEDLTRRLLQRWAPRLQQAGISSHTEFAPDIPHARADPRTMEQVIVNLITNAVQAMGEGGVLSAKLLPAPSDQGPMIELRIADTGPGIPAHVVERIFDPFFTTKKDGTGLGLAITRRILAAHKGGIWVESFPGAGTVFTLRVPAADKENRPT